jgi:hypothetical protein
LKTLCDFPGINDKLLLYLEGSITGEERKAIMLHAQGCAACSADLKELQEILGAVKTHAAALSRSTCPTPDVLINFAEQSKTLSAVESESIQKHLMSCSACRKDYDRLVELQEEPIPQPDFILMARGEKEFIRMASRQLPTSPRSVAAAVRTIAALVNGWKECIQDWVADFFSPPPELIVLRKGKRKVGEHLSIITERSRGIAVRIEIEPINANCIELMVFLSASGNKKLPEGMRATLFCDGAARVSFMVRGGKAVFKRVPHNTYELAFSKEGKEIKRIQFTTR